MPILLEPKLCYLFIKLMFNNSLLEMVESGLVCVVLTGVDSIHFDIGRLAKLLVVSARYYDEHMFWLSRLYGWPVVRSWCLEHSQPVPAWLSFQAVETNWLAGRRQTAWACLL